MESLKPRRKPVTYGKKSSARQLPAYNFLDHDLDATSAGASTLSTRSPDIHLGQTLPKKHHDFKPLIFRNHVPRSADMSPLSPNSSVQDRSDHSQNDSTNSSLFDLRSSDEEMGGTLDENPVRKRRRLTPLGKGTKQTKILKHKTKLKTKLQDVRNKSLVDMEVGAKSSGLPHNQAMQKKYRSRQVPVAKPRSRNRTPSLKNEIACEVPTDLMDDEKEFNFVSLTTSPTPPHTPAGKSPRIQQRSVSPSAQLIDQLYRSIPLMSQESKRGKMFSSLTHHADVVASPSQLAMRSLRLTPECAMEVDLTERHNLATANIAPLTPSRSRRRLVDALDSPRKQSNNRRAIVESPSSSREESLVNDDEPALDSNLQEAVQLDTRHVSFEDKNPLPSTTTVPKITYAKQRSHLSDMVIDDTSGFVVPSITHLTDSMTTTSAPVNNSFGSQKSQETPSQEEDQASGAIRSIHELRQAGVNSRFQSELESIFEDIEASGRTSKSRRLRGLMLLGEKFLDAVLALRFVENGMHQRLATYVQSEMDSLSLLLANCTLAIMLSSCQPSLKTLQQVFEAVTHSSTPLLKDAKDMTRFVKEIARDRKQNLSGATCKDIVDFQQTVLSSQIWTAGKPASLTPQLIALRSIEIAVRGIRESKDLDTSLPLPLFEELIAVVGKLAQDDKIDLLGPASPFLLEPAVSVLEFSVLSRGNLDNEDAEAAEKLCVLGPLLSKTKILPKERHDLVEQLVLRLTLSVTNNNVLLCESLGKTELIPAISTIVKDDFLDLAACADGGKHLDESKLETVILALGTLINFAECSHSSRMAMNEATADESSMVQWLATAFNTRAGKASEASSLEQTHALVAFGYMSMLICTLCLDDEIRNKFRSSMKSRSLHPLVVTVEEFLNHFRTVEQVMVEEEASNNFTERFDGILKALREAEGLP